MKRTNGALEPPIRVLVTGAAGHVAYPLLYMIGRGDLFGQNQPIILHLLELPEAFHTLQGVIMEMKDCNLPLLQKYIPTTDLAVAFRNISVAILCGAMPRPPHMAKRSDLIPLNFRIFKEHGRAIDRYARKNVKVCVVGNPVNTMAYVCMRYAPTIPPENFSAVTRLDQNRAIVQIADKLAIPVTAITNVFVWGNHAPSQLPDAKNATFKRKGNSQRVRVAVKNEYLEEELVEKVTGRGTALLTALKQSSGFSAAKAVCDHMHNWWLGTVPGKYVSMGVFSDGTYGTAKKVFFSFPVSICRKKWTIVKDLYLDEFSRERIRATGRELREEKAWANQLCDEDDEREAEEIRKRLEQQNAKTQETEEEAVEEEEIEAEAEDEEVEEDKENKTEQEKDAEKK